MKYLKKVASMDEAIQKEYDVIYYVEGQGVTIKLAHVEPPINPNVTTVIYSDGSRKEFVTANYISGITVQDPTFGSIPNPTDQLGDLSEAVEVYIGNNVTLIGECAFANKYQTAPFPMPQNKLQIVHIPNSVTTIENITFSDCKNLTSINIPNGVTSIGEYTFFQCRSLPSIIIPDSVTIICNSAFWYCRSLTSVTIPNSVTIIGSAAFSECSSLTSVTYSGSIAQWNAITKSRDWNFNVPSTCIVYCTDGDIPITEA